MNKVEQVLECTPWITFRLGGQVDRCELQDN